MRTTGWLTVLLLVGCEAEDLPGPTRRDAGTGDAGVVDAGGEATAGGSAGGPIAGGASAGGLSAGGSTSGGTAGGVAAGGSTAGGLSAGGAAGGGSLAGGSAGGAGLAGGTAGGRASRSAFSTIEAERYDSATGIMVGMGQGREWIGYFDHADSLEYRALDFGTGARAVDVQVAVPSTEAGQTIQFRLDAVTGPVVGSLVVAATADWFSFTSQRAPIAGATGVHDLFVVGVGAAGVGNVDSFRFVAIAGAAGGTAGGNSAGGTAGGTNAAGGTAGGTNAAGGTAGGNSAGGTAGGTSAAGGTAGGSSTMAVGPRIATLQSRPPVVATNGLTISGARITNPNGPCIEITNVSNVTVVDSELGPCGGSAAIVISGNSVSVRLSHLLVHDSARGVLVEGVNDVVTSNSVFHSINGVHPAGKAVQYNNVLDGGVIANNTVRGDYGSDAVSGYQSSWLRITDNRFDVNMLHQYAAAFTIGDSVTGPPGHDNYVARNQVNQTNGVAAGVFGSTGNTMLENNCFSNGIQAWNYNNAPFVGVTVRNNIIGPGFYVPNPMVVNGWSTNTFPTAAPRCQ